MCAVAPYHSPFRPWDHLRCHPDIRVRPRLRRPDGLSSRWPQVRLRPVPRSRGLVSPPSIRSGSLRCGTDPARLRSQHGHGRSLRRPMRARRGPPDHLARPQPRFFLAIRANPGGWQSISPDYGWQLARQAALDRQSQGLLPWLDPVPPFSSPPSDWPSSAAPVLPPAIGLPRSPLPLGASLRVGPDTTLHASVCGHTVSLLRVTALGSSL